MPKHRVRRPLAGAAFAIAALLAAGCAVVAASQSTLHPATPPTPTPAAARPTPPVHTATPVPMPAPPTPTVPVEATPSIPIEPAQSTPAVITLNLHQGDHGAAVLTLQQRLSDLGYWLGTPDGNFGDLTQQAVYALQKAAGLRRDGVINTQTMAALDNGKRPTITSTGSGHRIEINKATQLLLIIDGTQITTILNTSTGSGATYLQAGHHEVARTPSGTFHVFRQVDGEDIGPLGALWRPKYFNAGIAVHGYTSVPPYPASHGCTRVSNAAMNWIWLTNQLPIGTSVTVT
jgi:lipoprotein-anchoring transpeptidase ErfK/SrfK